jgi:hypothetical protein
MCGYIYLKFNFNFYYILGLNQIELLIFEHTWIDTILSNPVDIDSSDRVTVSSDHNTSDNDYDLHGTDDATYGESENEAYDSSESCDSYSSGATLVDDESDTSSLARVSDSEDSISDDGYEGDDESDNNRPCFQCPECISTNRVELLTENAPSTPTPTLAPTTENDTEVSSSTQAPSLSQPAPSTSSSSTSSSTSATTKWVLVTSLRLRLTVFRLTFVSFRLSEKLVVVFTFALIIKIIAICKTLTQIFFFTPFIPFLTILLYL